MRVTTTGFVIAGVIAAVFGATSLLHAGQTEPVAPVETQEERDEAAWDAWRTDFEARLAADEEYLAAEEALAGWTGDDEEEYAVLEDACARRYREVALVVYEEHFGEWSGTMDEFDEAVAAQPDDIAKTCAKTARETCGQGKVCWVKSDPKTGCGFACQDGKGGCPDYPAARMSTE